MVKKIFMAEFADRFEADKFRDKLQQDKDCPYHFAQVVPFGKHSGTLETRVVVIYIHNNEVE